ncbi:protein kinase [Streptomyces sp. LX-29]|uniref:serine/threonine protein kinase n=1 Tax=Streptomyces sp. LX-29 TaxID=2900152 RepID=UPI00240D13C6|nr:serine/threonine protein kinase [Streptomyces sp. LX-29]WFB08921.1 protein kinase [Streptomyces sp. LX-29]
MSEGGRLVAGRYRLIEKVGRGGMGAVWRAEDELLGRQIAVKRLHVSPHLADDELATLYERTRREARSAARITHPNVVVVHDVVEDGGRPCIVMEYVPGSTMADLLKGGQTIPAAEAARIGLAMVSALRAAHAAGVLHRDVKPGNVLLGADKRVVLTDFGIAMATGTSTLTKTGEVVGSIDYIAPERVRGRKPGPASDLWALGATLYQALEGRPPFRRDTAMETAYAIAVDPVDPTRNAGPLTSLVEALLDKDPDRRPSADAVERMLRVPLSDTDTTLFPAVSLTRPTAVQPAAKPVREPATPEPPKAPPARNEPAWAREPARAPEPEPEPVRDEPAPAPEPPRAPEPARTTATTRTPEPSRTTVTTPASEIPYSGGTSRRAGIRTFLSVVAAGVVGAAVVTGIYLASGGDGGGTKAEGKNETKSPTPVKTKHTAPPVPEGYVLNRVGELGLSVPVPKGWTLDSMSGRAVNFVDPTGEASLRINVLDFASTDPVEHFKEVEKDLRAKYSWYERKRLQETKFRNQPAAIWEMEFQGDTRRISAIDLGWGRVGEKEYALYLSAPTDVFDSYRSVFDRAKEGLRLPGDVEPRGAGKPSGSDQG